jgi:hypothetical protein
MDFVDRKLFTRPIKAGAVAKNATIDPLAGIQRAALRFRCSALTASSCIYTKAVMLLNDFVAF